MLNRSPLLLLIVLAACGAWAAFPVPVARMSDQGPWPACATLTTVDTSPSSYPYDPANGWITTYFGILSAYHHPADTEFPPEAFVEADVAWNTTGGLALNVYNAVARTYAPSASADGVYIAAIFADDYTAPDGSRRTWVVKDGIGYGQLHGEDLTEPTTQAEADALWEQVTATITTPEEPGIAPPPVNLSWLVSGMYATIAGSTQSALNTVGWALLYMAPSFAALALLGILWALLRRFVAPRLGWGRHER